MCKYLYFHVWALKNFKFTKINASASVLKTTLVSPSIILLSIMSKDLQQFLLPAPWWKEPKIRDTEMEKIIPSKP